MKIILISLTLFSLIACDAPQRTRMLSGIDSMKGNSQSDNFSDFNKGAGSFPDTPTSPTTPTISTGEYSGCDYSYKYHTMDIGHFAVCQSRSDETKFKFKTQLTHRNLQVCLIPTYRDNSGNSTYLGQPQCMFTEAGKDYEGRLHKSRSGFTGYAINGVIVLKYGLHNAYFNCMNASLSWPANACPRGANTSQQCYQLYGSCPAGSATNSNCSAMANNYMAQVCEQFKSSYRNSYADISTR